VGYYPVFLDLTGRRCLVVGGGAVGVRKVEGLLAADADVTVVSPPPSPALDELCRDGRIRWLQRDYRAGDLEGFALCLTATDDTAVNAAVAAEGRERGVWVNAADDPDNCDFILPSVLRRGDLQVAFSTGGRSPALARKIREELEAVIGPEYEALVDLAGEVRESLRAEGRSFDTQAWSDALAPDLRDLLREGRLREARDRLIEGLRARTAGRR
jgi:siroheme synthase-like protein